MLQGVHWLFLRLSPQSQYGMEGGYVRGVSERDHHIIRLEHGIAPRNHEFALTDHCDQDTVLGNVKVTNGLPCRHCHWMHFLFYE